jgi:hypothetical protein
MIVNITQKNQSAASGPRIPDMEEFTEDLMDEPLVQVE